MLRLLGRQLARPAALAAGAVGTACASGYAYHKRSSCEQSAPSYISHTAPTKISQSVHVELR